MPCSLRIRHTWTRCAGICRFWMVSRQRSKDGPLALECHILICCGERCAVFAVALKSGRAPERLVAYPLVRAFRVVGNLAPGCRASIAMA